MTANGKLPEDTKVKLVNSSDLVPKVFYVFTDTRSFITRHNLHFTNGFTSGSIAEIMASPELTKKYLDGTINYIQFVPNQQADVHGLSVYSANSTADYRIEYNCELYRKQHEETKLYPSRMSCIYAFGDLSSCEKVAEMHGWNLASVKKFKLVDSPLTRVVKVNMEIISLMRWAEPRGSWAPEEQEKIWRHYWSGGGNINLEIPVDGRKHQKVPSGVIWEYLIEGRLELVEPSQSPKNTQQVE